MSDGGTIEVYATLVCETPSAFLIRIGDDEFGKEASTHWLPKSKVERTPSHSPQHEDIFVVPEWLAAEKGIE